MLGSFQVNLLFGAKHMMTRAQRNFITSYYQPLFANLSVCTGSLQPSP